MSLQSLVCLSLLAVGCAAPAWAEDAPADAPEAQELHVEVDNTGVVVAFKDAHLGITIPERIPFSQKECRIGYRLNREEGFFTPLTNEIFSGNVEHIRLMLQSGKADPEERDGDGRGLTPMEYTDPAVFERKYGANAAKLLSPHREEIRGLLVQAIAEKHAEEDKRTRDFLASHPVEEPVPGNYRHCIGWTSGKPGITLCLYETRNADGTCGSVLRFRRDSTGMLLREASGHISRGTQGHIPYMLTPRLCWIPQEGVPGDTFVIYAPGRVWTPFAIMRLEWGRDCGEPESASLPPEGLPILTPLYQGTINAYRPRHRLREKDGKRYIDFYDAAEDEPDSASPRASFYLPIEPAKQ